MCAESSAFHHFGSDGKDVARRYHSAIGFSQESAGTRKEECQVVLATTLGHHALVGFNSSSASDTMRCGAAYGISVVRGATLLPQLLEAYVQYGSFGKALMMQR